MRIRLAVELLATALLVASVGLAQPTDKADDSAIETVPDLATEDVTDQVNAQIEERGSVRGLAQGDAVAPSSAALDTINRILEEDQVSQQREVLAYDAGGRRDPFLSLLARSTLPAARGPRPSGIPGLLIDDLSLRGVFVTPRGSVAQVQASTRAASYLLRVGDRLFDGEVLAIRYRKHEAAEVVFKQGVKDPAAIKPFREVVKRITH